MNSTRLLSINSIWYSRGKWPLVKNLIKETNVAWNNYRKKIHHIIWSGYWKQLDVINSELKGRRLTTLLCLSLFSVLQRASVLNCPFYYVILIISFSASLSFPLIVPTLQRSLCQHVLINLYSFGISFTVLRKSSINIIAWDILFLTSLFLTWFLQEMSQNFEGTSISLLSVFH